MEKISGIIPANRRTKAVDVSNSQPVRPGAPTWGRPVGRVTQQMLPDPLEKVSFSQLEPELKGGGESPMAQATYNSRGQMARSQVVEELSKKFFEPSVKNVARDSDETLSEQVQNQAAESEFTVGQKSQS